MTHAYSKLLFVSSIFVFSQNFAQEISRSSINSGGNVVRSQGIILSQSIGQSAPVGVVNNDNLQLRQGFQQPILLSRGKDKRTINITLFPNPNDGRFSFLTDLDRNEAFTYQIMDAQGKLIFSGDSEGGQLTQVEVKEQTQTGTYFMSIISKNNWRGEAKIVITN